MSTPNLQTHPQGPRNYINQVWSNDNGFVNLVPNAQGAYVLKGNYRLSKPGCADIKPGTVEIAYRNATGPADVTADDSAVAGVLNDGSNDVGTIESYGPYFKFTLTPGITLEDGSVVTLTFTDTCGDQRVIQIAKVFSESGLDVTYGEIDTQYQFYASFCPVDVCEQTVEIKLCNQTIATIDSNGRFVPQGDDWKGRIFGHYFPAYCAACSSAGEDVVAINFSPQITREEAKTLELVAGTLRVPMDGCAPCCTYEWDFSGATFGATTQLKQIVVNGSEKLGSSLPADGSGVANLAALIAILNDLGGGMGTFTNPSADLLRIEDSQYVWGDITLDENGTDNVISLASGYPDCPGCTEE